MKTLKAIFCLQLRMAVNRRNIIVLAILLLITMILLHEGVNKHKKILQNIEVFQKTEREKVKLYVTITQYGGFGIGFLFIPASNSIMFNNNGLYEDMGANVDVGERLNIESSFKGRRLFSERNSFMDFAGILLLFSASIGLIYGFKGGNKSGFRKHIASLAKKKKLFLASILVKSSNIQFGNHSINSSCIANSFDKRIQSLQLYSYDFFNHAYVSEHDVHFVWVHLWPIKE